MFGIESTEFWVGFGLSMALGNVKLITAAISRTWPKCTRAK